MGEVWRATDIASGTPLAVKFLRLVRAGDGGDDETERSIVERLRAEASVLARLNNEHILPVFDFGVAQRQPDPTNTTTQPTPFLVMPWVEGPPLASLAGTLTPSRLVSFLGQVLLGLAHAHARGVIHRDLKPANILLRATAPSQGRFRTQIVDFGIARHLARPLATDDAFHGTPAYMAPEQCQGAWRDEGPWTDLYALGVVAFQLAYGVLPFHAPDPSAVYEQHINHPLPPPPRPEPFPGMHAWIERLTQKSTRARPSHARDAYNVLMSLAESAGHSVRDLSYLTLPRIDGARESAEDAHRAARTSSTNIAADLTTNAVYARVDVTDDVFDTPAATDVPAANYGSRARGAAVTSMPAAARAWSAPTWIALDVPARRAEASSETPPRGLGLGIVPLRDVPIAGRDAERRLLWETLRETLQPVESSSPSEEPDTLQTQAYRPDATEMASTEHRGYQPRAVVLRGLAGTGKTRLARWFAEESHALGIANTLWVRHQSTGGPFDGFADAIARVLGASGLPLIATARRVAVALQHDSAADAIGVRALGRIIANATATRIGSEAEARTIEGSISRDRTEHLDTYRVGLEALARDRALVVVVDDVAWGRDALEIVRHALATITSRPILFVLIAQDEALAGQTTVATQLAALVEGPNVAACELGLLTADNLGEVLDTMLGIDPGLREALLDRAGGLPSYALHLIEDWVTRGLLERGSDGRFVLNSRDVPELPESLHRLWTERMERATGALPAATLDALAVASFLGVRVDPAEFDRACHHAGIAWRPTALGALVDAKLARWEADGGWSFAHNLARDCVAQAARERGSTLRLHAACAKALDELYVHTRVAAVAERRALHHAEAGDDVASALASCDAAHAHMIDAAWEACRVWTSRAESSLRRELSTRDDAAPRDPRLAGRVGILQAKGAFYAGDSAGALEAIRQSRIAIGPNAPDEIRAELSAFEAVVAISRGEMERAEALIQEAARHGDATLETDLATTRGILCVVTGRAREAITSLERALTTEATLRSPYTLARTLHLLADAHMSLEANAEVIAYAERALKVIEPYGFRYLELGIRNSLACGLSAIGRVDEARQQLRELLGSVPHGSPHAGYARYNLSVIEIRANAFEAARGWLRGALELADAVGPGRLWSFVYCAWLVCVAASADRASWDALAPNVLKTIKASSLRDPEFRYLAARAVELWELVGDAEAADLARALGATQNP